MITYRCRKCGETMESPESCSGGLERCPTCGEANAVPTAAGGPPPLPPVPTHLQSADGSASEPGKEHRRSHTRKWIVAAVIGGVAVLGLMAVVVVLVASVGKSNIVAGPYVVRRVVPEAEAQFLKKCIALQQAEPEGGTGNQIADAKARREYAEKVSAFLATWREHGRELSDWCCEVEAVKLTPRKDQTQATVIVARVPSTVAYTSERAVMYGNYGPKVDPRTGDWEKERFQRHYRLALRLTQDGAGWDHVAEFAEVASSVKAGNWVRFSGKLIGTSNNATMPDVYFAEPVPWMHRRFLHVHVTAIAVIE